MQPCCSFCNVALLMFNKLGGPTTLQGIILKIMDGWTDGCGLMSLSWYSMLEYQHLIETLKTNGKQH